MCMCIYMYIYVACLYVRIQVVHVQIQSNTCTETHYTTVHIARQNRTEHSIPLHCIALHTHDSILRLGSVFAPRMRKEQEDSCRVAICQYNRCWCFLWAMDGNLCIVALVKGFRALVEFYLVRWQVGRK